MDYKEYVETNSNCKLLNVFRKNNRIYFHLKCECTEEFEVDYYKFKDKKICNKCSSKLRGLKREKDVNIKEIEDDYYKKTKLKVKIFEIKQDYISETRRGRKFVYFKYLKQGFENEIFYTRIDRFKKGNIQIFKGHDDVYRRYSGKKKTHEEFKRELNFKRDNIFTLLSEYKGALSDIKVKNNICGHEFTTKATNLISSRKVSCPICNFSKMEEIIYLYLKNNNIDFKYQYKFNDCKNIKPLPFDFYLPKYKIIIEADGKQHTEITTGYFGGLEGYLDRKKKDLIKNKFCRDNDLKMIRISYLEADKIKNIIKYGIKI